MERYDEINKILINYLNGFKEISKKIVDILIIVEEKNYMMKNQVKYLVGEYNISLYRHFLPMCFWGETFEGPSNRPTPFYKFILVKNKEKINVNKVYNIIDYKFDYNYNK